MNIGKLIAIGFAILLMAEAPSKETVAKYPNAGCIFTDAQRDKNRHRAWTDFEFSTTELGGPMAFNSNRCWQSAVDASADYLANGPLLSEKEKAITLFHMARNLARTGDHKGAARLAAASRRYNPPATMALDWNSYVAGFYAFLIGDRASLDIMTANLLTLGGEGNMMNAKVLQRAQKCFDEPFLVVEEAKWCAANPNP